MLAALAMLLTGMQGVPPPPGVTAAQERLVVGTPAGLIVIALYPEVAPKNVAQIMKLAKEGVFDGICIPRIEPGFILQFSGAELDRQPPLPASLHSLIQPLPAEFSSLKHVRGTVNMARKDGDVNSASSSFCILLGDAPHLDGKYTIIGHVEYGMDVVDELVKAPRTGNQPNQRLAVPHAGLVPGREIHDNPPPRAKPLFGSGTSPVNPGDEQALQATREREWLFATGILLMIVCSLINVFVPRLTAKQMQTINLTNVLIGVFLIVAILQPISFSLFQSQEGTTMGHLLAIVIFFGLLALFRLMSRFESPS